MQEWSAKVEEEKKNLLYLRLLSSLTFMLVSLTGFYSRAFTSLSYKHFPKLCCFPQKLWKITYSTSLTILPKRSNMVTKQGWRKKDKSKKKMKTSPDHALCLAPTLQSVCCGDRQEASLPSSPGYSNRTAVFQNVLLAKVLKWTYIYHELYHVVDATARKDMVANRCSWLKHPSHTESASSGRLGSAQPIPHCTTIKFVLIGRFKEFKLFFSE